MNEELRQLRIENKLLREEKKQALQDNTTPPAQRPWVGLTDEQKKIAIWTDGTFGAGALWAEAKLKDKNNG
jgi:hypothetical protein